MRFTSDDLTDPRGPLEGRFWREAREHDRYHDDRIAYRDVTNSVPGVTLHRKLFDIWGDADPNLGPSRAAWRRFDS